MTKIVYNGLLCLHSDGEADHILFLHNVQEPLAEEFYFMAGKQVSIRYYISDIKRTKEELEEDLIKKLYGIGEVHYGHRYSDYTGYLWTDEDLKVGGHNLLNELRQNIDKWLYLEVEY